MNLTDALTYAARITREAGTPDAVALEVTEGDTTWRLGPWHRPQAYPGDYEAVPQTELDAWYDAAPWITEPDVVSAMAYRRTSGGRAAFECLVSCALIEDNVEAAAAMIREDADSAFRRLEADATGGDK